MPTQDAHRPPTDGQDPRPELPNDHPSNPITDVGLHEDMPSRGATGAAQQVMTTAVGSPAFQGDTPAITGGDGVVVAKKVLESATAPGMGSNAGEEEQEQLVTVTSRRA
jgi:hypothetical protein